MTVPAIRPAVTADIEALGPFPRILAQSHVAAPVTGTASETALATITIPAGAMGVKDSIRVTTLWSMTNSANNKTLRTRFGGAAGTAYQSGVFTTVVSLRDQRQISNRNAANSQVGWNSGGAGGFNSSASAVVTSAVDTTAAVDIVISGQLANTGETITLEGYTVELLPAP